MSPVRGLVNTLVVDSPLPSNLTYMWNFGSILGLVLGIQIVTGVFLAMNYVPDTDLAFYSVEHIMRETLNGWIVRYTHANGAGIFFIAVYIHMARGMYYGSYRAPRVLLWSVGVIIFLVMMGTAFIGYVLPWGQMSFWGATVITNFLSAVPYIGKDLVELVWGGYSVDKATLNRFFSLHYLLPFILAALAGLHLLALHEHGSNNPLGYGGNVDKIRFHPYYTYKDLVGFVALIMILMGLVFYNPNLLGHSDNYIEANRLVTPAHISPEFYFLPYYTILRAIPSKIGGVLAMVGAILIMLILPFVDTSRIRGVRFRPIGKVIYWGFMMNFMLLLWIGSCGVEEPYIFIGRILTIIYFSYYIVIVPVIGYIEEVLSYYGRECGKTM